MNDVIEDYYQDNYKKFVNRIRFRAGSLQNAEDVVQEAFTRALQYIGSFDENKKPFDTWFRTICNNTLKDFKRDEKSLGTYVEFNELMFETEPVQYSDGRIREEIKKMIAKERHDGVLHLYYTGGYTPKEIVEIVDLNKNTVLTILKRFRGKVLARFKEE